MLTHQSLVKYNNPILVSTTSNGGTNSSSKRGPQKKALLSPTEDILNSILPPREWTEHGQLWVQYVSSTPATRLNVVTLQNDLDRKLQQRQAREIGICPIREELYSQSFDELIRQVTINCAERGLLLLRVRDELRMTVAAYQTLYESSIAFGTRKALQAEQNKADMDDKGARLSSELRELDASVRDMMDKCAELEDTNAQQWLDDEAKHNKEVAELRMYNNSLKAKLENTLSMPAEGK